MFRRCASLIGRFPDFFFLPRFLEPIREVWIHADGFAASRFSMMRIMERRMKAATVLA
jgi:hypothetical protein